MTSCKTWVIIVRFKAEKEIEGRPFAFPMRHLQNGQERVKITESQAIPVDQPLLLLPDGETDSVEIIPIMGSTIIHGRNIRRVLQR